jgi:hypothetical protein
MDFIAERFIFSTLSNYGFWLPEGMGKAGWWPAKAGIGATAKADPRTIHGDSLARMDLDRHTKRGWLAQAYKHLRNG